MAKKSLKENLDALKAAKTTLGNCLGAIGAGESSTDGLLDLEGRVRSAVVPKGTVTTARVSKAGTIFAGDGIRFIKEFDPGPQIRFALDGVSVIATGKLNNTTAVVAFAQGGDTYVKAVKHFNGTWQMGNTLLLVEGEVLSAACLVSISDTSMAAVYNSDAAGMVSFIRFNGLVATVAYVDIWDAYDPTNIAATARVPERGAPLVISYLRSSAATAEYRGKAYMIALSLGATSMTAGTETPVTVPDNTGAATDLKYSKDEYIRAWAIAFHGSTIYLTFYRSATLCRGILTAKLKGLEIIPQHVTNCTLDGSLPVAAMTAVETTTQTTLDGSVALAHGITRLQAGATKSMLGLEFWHSRHDADRVLPISYGEEDVTYSTNIGRVCVGQMAKDTCMIAYSHNNVMRASVVDVQGYHAIGGPSVQLCTFDAYADVVAISGNLAMLVYQSGRSGYVKALYLANAVAASTAASAEGIAMTGGTTGQTIKLTKRA